MTEKQKHFGWDHDKRKNVMNFLTGLCQDDFTTSSGDVMSRNKLDSQVQEEIFGKVIEGILKICYGSGVIQQKVGLGSFLPPVGCMRVKRFDALFDKKLRYFIKKVSKLYYLFNPLVPDVLFKGRPKIQKEPKNLGH